MFRGGAMEEWALELLKNNKLSDLDVDNIVEKVKLNDVAFSKESKETSATSEAGRLVRYWM